MVVVFGILLTTILSLTCWAGPVEFGRAELDRALRERGSSSLVNPIITEITGGGSESYRIHEDRITGSDERGLMYGLLEAAEQVRINGRLVESVGSAATPIRGVRQFLHNSDLEADWYYSRQYWLNFFTMLAKNRFNRFNLVFAHQTAYLSPPYPYWFILEEFPEVRVGGLSEKERVRNYEMLQFIIRTAGDHGVDFTLGIWQQNVWAGQGAEGALKLEGLTSENVGPYSHAALKKVLTECRGICSIQLRANAESGISANQQVEVFGKWVLRAIREANRPVSLDLRSWGVLPELLEVVGTSGVPLRLSTKYWMEHIGRPYQPADSFLRYGYRDLLKKPRPYDFFWEVWGLGSHRLLVWGDPAFVRRAVPTFRLSGSVGFEIDVPLAQKGFGNRPGKWGVFTSSQQERVFWEYEFERYWLFYLLWGRLSYDPDAPNSIWMRELDRRFGKAADNVLEAYLHSSRVLSEIVTVHMSNPNMYVWPEINPGGPIDAYAQVRNSDWRFVTTIAEAVRNQAKGRASAKQTPWQTAVRLDSLADKTEEAIRRVRSRLRPDNVEWKSTEPDILVLAALARFHARKQVAACHLVHFYLTGSASSLETARREMASGVRIWEKLVELTDGLYPEEMAFGPTDIGHWKEKLPYIYHDQKLIEERQEILDRFGLFDFGFDFGGPPRGLRGPPFLNDPFTRYSTLEPRFRPVDPDTAYTPWSGYGFVSQASRKADSLVLSPENELRASVHSPGHLPGNALYGDSIGMSGRNMFRVDTEEDGPYVVRALFGGGAEEVWNVDSINGFLLLRFPHEEKNIAGLVINRAGRIEDNPPPLSAPPPLRRPVIRHVPPESVQVGQPLALCLDIESAADIALVRLYYRPLNQREGFRMLEVATSQPQFTIPAEHISPYWDLTYYFEILNRSSGGWFQPDPAVATPYYVVEVVP